MNADWSGVYAITDKFRVQDSFRYDNWRIPGLWATYETNIFGAAGSGQVGLALATFLVQSGFPLRRPTRSPRSVPRLPTTRRAARFHTSSSGADVTNELSYQFLGQNLKSNTFELQYDFNKRLSGRMGYLYTNRTIAQFSATFDTGETYFPGGTARTAADYYLAARGDCALSEGQLPTGCALESGWLDHGRLADESSSPKRVTTRPAH